MSRPILEVSGLTMRFGGLLAVNNVALSVQPKQVVSMIGPNGAGKTTVFNCLTGFYQPTGGVILLDDDDRENEGDLIVAADRLTVPMMATMISRGTP